VYVSVCVNGVCVSVCVTTAAVGQCRKQVLAEHCL